MIVTREQQSRILYKKIWKTIYLILQVVATGILLYATFTSKVDTQTAILVLAIFAFSRAPKA